MRCGIHQLTAVLVATVLLGACQQMPRHSNTVFFGTNTSFGLNVGTDATSTPSIAVGYKRQEAVVMPLLANEEGNNPPDGAMKPVPCPNDVTPCLFRGTDGEDVTDTYSVLASFGAQFSGETGTGGAKAAGGLAQYFATGLAARELAKVGGAALVATGEAAAASASGNNELIAFRKDQDMAIAYADTLDDSDAMKFADTLKAWAVRAGQSETFFSDPLKIETKDQLKAFIKSDLFITHHKAFVDAIPK